VAARLASLDHVTNGVCHLGAIRSEQRGQAETFFCHRRAESKRGRIGGVKYWEIIADNLKKAGWSLGWVSAIDSNGRTIWIADAHRGDGKRFIVHADEKLTAFVELEAAVEPFSASSSL
jgi:hypothetical protein